MKRPPARGFTLIEMLIALSIFAALIAVLMLGFGQGLSLWGKAQGRSFKWQSLEYRYDLLSNLFLGAQAAEYTRVAGKYVPYYLGSRRAIRFLSRAPILDFPERIRPVELELVEQSDNTFNLFYREGSRSSDPARGIDWAKASEHLLLVDIKDAYFMHEAASLPLPIELDPLYLDPREKIRYRENAEWLERFNASWMWRLPQRVSLNFSDPDGVKHRWTFPLPTASDAWSLELFTDD